MRKIPGFAVLVFGVIVAISVWLILAFKAKNHMVHPFPDHHLSK